MDIIAELNRKLDELITLSRLVEDYGSRFAQAEHDYKVEVSKEVFKLKESGMAVTLINLIVYGQPAVAKLRLQRDLSQVLYDASKEKINALKLYIRVMESQLQLERYERD